MPTTVIANATIVTVDAMRNVLHDGAIAITDDVVAASGRPRTFSRHIRVLTWSTAAARPYSRV
jgi:hypothetical protein